MGILRTVLALAVVLAHSPPRLNGAPIFVGGRYAVQLFYIISGFLIAYVLRNDGAYKNPMKFYANRMLRLYPCYYVVAILAVLAALLIDQDFFEYYRRVPTLAAIVLALTNILIIGQDWVLFLAVKGGDLAFTSNFQDSDVPLYEGLIIPPAWTLGVELAFYAIAPFVLRSPKRIVLLLTLSVAVRLVLVYRGLATQDPWNYRFFPAELSLFLLGALSSQYGLPLWQRLVLEGKLSWVPRAGTGILLAIVIFYFVVPLSGAIKAPLLFAAFLVLLPLAFMFQNTSRADRALGELSYPIYVSHALVISVSAAACRALDLQLSMASISMMNILFVCVFAYYLNLVVAKRIERLRSRIKSRRVQI